MSDNEDYDKYEMYDDVVPLSFEEYAEITMVCPCCHENEITDVQAQDCVEGETCAICQFHTWEWNA